MYLENKRVRDALASVISEISHRKTSHRKTLYSIVGDEGRVELYKDLEERAISMVKVWDKYAVVKILRSVLNDDFVDDTIKLKFIRLAAVVSE